VSGERPEAHTLLGPYVMDALDSKDRARFERHLGRCQECTTEAGSLREATGRLAAATCPQPDAAAKEQAPPNWHRLASFGAGRPGRA
jgi:anti-sigma factor RsiW